MTTVRWTPHKPPKYSLAATRPEIYPHLFPTDRILASLWVSREDRFLYLLRHFDNYHDDNDDDDDYEH
jgi:hypothetical protein